MAFDALWRPLAALLGWLLLLLFFAAGAGGTGGTFGLYLFPMQYFLFCFFAS